jgi:hypothetical protein
VEPIVPLVWTDFYEATGLPAASWAVGLSELFEPGALVEMSCVAVVSRERR